MDFAHPENPVVVNRVAESHWHAVEDDQVVGRGAASRRPDGRVFVSIDAWHGPVFDQLAAAMRADLPKPLHTVVDEADFDLISAWERAGFTTSRREWEYLVPTDPQVTGLGSAQPPPGVTILPVGRAEEAPLRALDRAIRDEVGATIGWQQMPAEVLTLPDGATVHDPSKYAVAAQSDRYVGLLRLGPVVRQPRIGLIAVRTEFRRQGIARALLAQVLDALHRDGIKRASADVQESHWAATALFEGVHARRASSNLELTLG
jgi:ribosomal protein S18 acetylase RimI-like enzyme